MSINFKEIVLNNYGGFKLKADVDENPEDIVAAVCYCDHGDDFLVIKTKDACYEYGLFVTRNGHDARCLNDENHYQRSWFLKVPKLTGPIDYRSETANDIYFFICKTTVEDGGFCQRDKTRVYSKQSYAQMEFDILCDRLEEYYNTGKVYHCNGSSYLSNIMDFLKANDILIEENLQKIEDVKTYFRIDTIDGSAGKKKTLDVVIGDDVRWIYYNGEKVTKKYHKHGIKVKSFHTDDDYGGYDGFIVNMDQFKEKVV